MNLLKKIGVPLFVLSSTLFIVGCNDVKENSGVEEDIKEEVTYTDKEVVKDVFVNDIMLEIKNEMVEVMKSDGTAEEDIYKDGKLSYYDEIDLVNKVEDSFADILLERMELDSSDLIEGVVLIPMMNVKSDEIILLKAKDETKVETLKKSLEKELESQIHTWELYLPDQYEKVKNNKIIIEGNYLLYVTFDDSELISETFKNIVK